MHNLGVNIKHSSSEIILIFLAIHSRVGKMTAFMSKVHATGVTDIFRNNPAYSSIFWHFQKTILNRHYPEFIDINC